MKTEKIMDAMLNDVRGKPIDMAAFVDYAGGSVVSKTLLDKKAGTLTLFSFDEGQGVSTYDLMDTITADMVKVNLLAIGAVFLILLLMKRQLLLPVILVLSIETAIWINLAIPYFRGRHVFYIAYLIISTIQLGATVDYAILFSDRYQEFRETLGKKQAIAATVSTVTTSVITTGSALAVVGFLMGAISTNQLLGQLGNFLGVGGLVSLAIVLLALPGYLYLADPLIIKPKKQPKEA